MSVLWAGRARWLPALAVCLFWSFSVPAAEPPPAGKPAEKKTMREVNGEFTVKVTPVDIGDAKMGMMLLDKEYLGDLAGVGKGRMLTGMTDVKGSAAYVAIERFEGTLQKAKGTFLLQHTGVMSKAGQSLVITIVPDSGTGELAGIEGKLHITITGGKHFYKLEYSLGAK